MIRRLLQWRNLWRALKYALLAGFTCALVAIAAFLLVARTKQRDFTPVADPVDPAQSARIAAIPKYRRDEDATYLTFPEWYLVFNPQEYAQHLAADRPSRFPYFRGIAQMWGSYAEVYGLARRHYPFNPGYNTMLVVICTSSTVEFAIKGVYEKTVGRLFEWTAGGATTPEDAFAAQVAKEYGDFIPTRPWFEFPFGRKFKELWTTNKFFGPHFLRKCERKFFLSLEYGIKSVYAAVIGWASHSAYGVADTEVHASVRNLGDAALAHPGIRRVQNLGGGRAIITVPHYQGFTDLMPLLARDRLQFDEIAGNDEIMLTLVAPSEWTYDLGAGRPLFSMALLTGPAFKRVAIQVPVKALSDTLREIDAKNLRLEHLYDY
jgi:hypothetical protein